MLNPGCRSILLSVQSCFYVSDFYKRCLTPFWHICIRIRIAPWAIHFAVQPRDNTRHIFCGLCFKYVPYFLPRKPRRCFLSMQNYLMNHTVQLFCCRNKTHMKLAVPLCQPNSEKRSCIPPRQTKYDFLNGRNCLVQSLCSPGFFWSLSALLDRANWKHFPNLLGVVGRGRKLTELKIRLSHSLRCCRLCCSSILSLSDPSLSLGLRNSSSVVQWSAFPSVSISLIPAESIRSVIDIVFCSTSITNTCKILALFCRLDASSGSSW